MMQGRRRRHLLHGEASETASRLKPEGVARFILGIGFIGTHLYKYFSRLSKGQRSISTKQMLRSFSFSSQSRAAEKPSPEYCPPQPCS